MDMGLKTKILNCAADAARNFAYYGRKEDEELSPGQLGGAIASGVVTIAEIVEAFEGDLRGWAGLSDAPTTGEGDGE